MAFRRPEAEAATAFRAPIQRLSVQARLQWPLLRGWAVPFVQAGGGPAWASTAYRDGNRDDRQIFASGHVIASGGLQVVPSFRGWRLVGLFVRADASYAPVLINELDERHKSRGLATHLGVRVGY